VLKKLRNAGLFHSRRYFTMTLQKHEALVEMVVFHCRRGVQTSEGVFDSKMDKNGC